MAKLFLETTDATYKVSTANTKVYGATGSQVVTVDAAATAVTFDANVEGVSFSGATSDFTYKQIGLTDLGVYKGTDLVATVAIQDDATTEANGSLLSFSNGTVSAKFATVGSVVGLTLGGTAVSATSATTVTPTTFVSTTGNGSTSTPVTGSTFTLTTGVDLSGVLLSASGTTSTAGNDTFNALLGTGATFNVFDNINAGEGTDTLNLVDGTAGAFAITTNATLAGFETVNLSRAATGAASIGATITDTTFGTGVKTLNFAESGAASTAAAVSVTLNSAETVNIINTNTAAKFNGVTVADTTAVATTTGSTLKTVTIQGGSTSANAIWGNAVATVNLNDTGAVETVVNAAAGTRAVTVNTTGTAAVGGFTDATATTLNINSNGTVAMALGTFTAAKATTVNYASSVIANTSLTLTAATATTLNISGTKVANITLTGNTALATVNVTGSAGLTTDLTTGATAVTLLDTTGTTGKSIVTVNTNTVVNGGAGADFITVANTLKAISLGAGNDQATVTVTALGAGGAINGGDGIDELVLTNANAVTLSTAGATQTAFKTAVTGFEVLNIGTQSASTVSATGAGTFTTVKMTSAAAAQVLSDVSSGQTIQSVFGAAGTSVTTNSLTGATDSLFVNLSGDLSAAGRSFGTFATPGVETVNIVTADTNTTFAAKQALVTLTDANATSIVVSGNNGLNLVHTGTSLNSFNASGLTKGAVSFTSAVLTTDTAVNGSATGGDYLNFAATTAKVTATTTAGANTVAGSATLANTITGGTGADTIYGGAAADVINGGAGDDVIFADAITAAGEVQTTTFTTTNGTAGATVTVGGVAVAISDTSTPEQTTDSIIAAANTIIASNPNILSITKVGVTTVFTYKPFTGDVAATTVTTTSAAQTNAQVETTKGIVPGATGTGTTHAAADVLTGGAGSDTFNFTAGGAITLASTITDLNLGSNVQGGRVDQIIIDGATTSVTTGVAVVTLTAAQQTSVTATASLTAAVDAVLAIAGTVNNVAQFTYGSDTYLIHNGATANATYTAGEDTLIKVTGVTGTLDASDFTIV